MEKAESHRPRGHPSLRGGSTPFPHQFNDAQMESLAAVCETFVPSLSLDGSSFQWSNSRVRVRDSVGEEEVAAKTERDEIDTFYWLSASNTGLALHVAGYLFRTLKVPRLTAVGWILRFMSTRIGTFLLFGKAAFTWQFPFVLSFPAMSPQQREDSLLSWARSSTNTFNVLFKLFKSYALFCHYAKVDDNGWNPSWDAMGYPGPDPERIGRENGEKPLEGKVLDPKTFSDEKLISRLDNEGFTIVDDISHLTFLHQQDRKKWSNKKREIGIKCDVVVVGSGSGGGVVAGVLAKAGYKVLVLERGQYFAREDLSLLEAPTFDSMYEGSGILSTDDGNVTLLVANTVGGGSAINWAASLRTPDHVRKEWADVHGLDFVMSDTYTHAMDVVCDRLGVKSNSKSKSFQNHILAEGCEACGYDIGEIPRNVEGEHSCGWCNFGCINGEKKATSETWLVDAVHHGALILSGCEVLQVLHEKQSNGKKDRKAVGVVSSFGDNVLLYVEARVTVLSSGSLNTPPLLLRSGLKNSNIGMNLHLHPVIMGWGYFPNTSQHPGTAYEGAIMTAVSKEAANWDTSGYGALLETPSLHPGSFSALIPWQSGYDHKGRMRRYSRTTHFIVLLRDRDGGQVRLDSEGRREIIYGVSKYDAERMLDALEKGLRVLAAAGAEEIGTQHWESEIFSLAENSASSEEFECFLRQQRIRGLDGLKTPICSAHQMGSCRMGFDKNKSVVDQKGETWEVEKLFVGDASVFPTASGVNPMITVQSMAYCIGQNILDVLSRC